ncbi:non-canonical ubiquitin conjugating enzyme 1 [Thelephora terrestris]|uniref:Non-canonical ubiquitin conjugating enzyme 1 n=1 Tax=Thelephora terrestris TaxID=56493 RepID=A0A9P6HPM3_9AGAM|nr:non-canonical ubiquitin conjugating enzyme 1 [Thelephora terrestris]
MSATSLNKNNSAVRRILQEAKELASDESTDYTAAPLEEWHCTIRGPAGTEFEGGLYHFRILLPSEYPFRPPSILMLTPNGRFELNTKICISFTSYHEESWQPAWGVRTAILGLQGFFPLRGKAALGVGGMDSPISDRKRLAALSRNWVCPRCEKSNLECLPDPFPGGLDSETIEPQPPETNLQVEVTQATEDGPIEGTPVADSPPSSSLRDHPPGELLPTTTPIVLQTVVITRSPVGNPRPPLLLDTAICVLLVLTLALLFRRFA